MKKLYVGIDIGGSTIKGVLLEESTAKPIRIFMIPMPNNKQELEQKLFDFTKKLIGERKIAGIGIGVPGFVDLKRNTLVRAANIPFLKNWNPESILRSFKAPIRMDNDSKCFLRGEALLGAGRGHKNIVAIAIGTGIGSGFLINGKIYRGSHNAAGELGHTVIDRGKTFEQLGAKKAFLKTGDTSKVIGIGVANAINTLDPDIVILGGGGGLSKKVSMKTVRSVAQKYSIYSVRGKIPIVQGTLGEFAQAIGAALLFSKNLSN